MQLWQHVELLLAARLAPPPSPPCRDGSPTPSRLTSPRQPRYNAPGSSPPVLPPHRDGVPLGEGGREDGAGEAAVAAPRVLVAEAAPQLPDGGRVASPHEEQRVGETMRAVHRVVAPNQTMALALDREWEALRAGRTAASTAALRPAGSP